MSRSISRPEPGLAPSAIFGLAVLASLALGTSDVSAQSWRNETMSRQRAGEVRLDVHVRYGVGEFRLRPGRARTLYEADLRYDEERFEPVSRLDGERLELGVRTLRDGARFGKRDERGELDLRLGRDLPMSLELELGAVEAHVDLGGLSLERLDLESGASSAELDVSTPNPIRMRKATLAVGAADFEARRLGNLNAEVIEVSAGVGGILLDFSGEWRADGRIDIDLGLGGLELVFPRGVGVRLEKSSFLATLDAEGLTRRGGVWFSDDWDTAERRITVNVDAAFGAIDVRWDG